MAGSTVAAHANDLRIDESSADLVAYQQLQRLNLTIEIVAGFLGECDCIPCAFYVYPDIHAGNNMALGNVNYLRTR